MAAVRRLLPATEGPPADLDDDALAEAYAVPTPTGRPWHLRMNFVSSVDGGVTVDERSAGLSNPADQRVFALLRDLADVVLVGAGTARTEGYRAERYGPDRRRRRVQLGRAELPVIAVVSGSLDLDSTSKLFTDTESTARTVVITCRAAPRDRMAALAEVADVLVAGDDRVDLTAALAELAERGLARVLSEGGPTLFGALLAAGLVDELCLTVSPLLTGPGTGRIVAGPVLADAPYPVALLHLLAEDGALLLRYALPAGS
jgi:5-amino-6-(5-phosphoribosylamino)uracil reductase